MPRYVLQYNSMLLMVVSPRLWDVDATKIGNARYIVILRDISLSSTELSDTDSGSDDEYL